MPFEIAQPAGPAPAGCCVRATGIAAGVEEHDRRRDCLRPNTLISFAGFFSSTLNANGIHSVLNAAASRPKITKVSKRVWRGEPNLVAARRVLLS
jgi:hypothetical protein